MCAPYPDSIGAILMRVRLSLVSIPDCDEPIYQLNDKDFAACTLPSSVSVVPASMPQSVNGLQAPAATASRKRTR